MLSSRSIQHIWTAVTSLVTRDRGRLLDDEIVDMNGNTNQALCDVLDEKEPAAGADANVEGGSEDLAALLQEEHEARLQAEASCQDHVQRLAVHSEQVSEYAQQKAADLAEIRKQAQALKGLLGTPDTSTAPELTENLNRLFKYLEDASDDALSFANQAQQDANRHRVQPDASGTDAGPQGGNDDSKAEPVPPVKESGTDAPEEAHEGSEAMDADDVAGSAPEQSENGIQTAVASPQMPVAAVTASPALAMFRDQAAYTPMRLDMKERRCFQLLEATLGVSEYTDKVDILTWKRKDGRVLQQVKDICSILSGLVVAQDYRRGQELVKNRDFKANETFFKDVFEVGRRYKIMNPDRMRGTYGKLLYMLMDTADSNIEDLLEFSCIKPLMTVKKYLESVGASKMLEDPRLMVATAEIDGSPDRPRYQIQQDLAKKEQARKQLARTHATTSCPPDGILNAVYALSDYNTYLLFNRDPVERMLAYLRRYFDPHKCSEGESLAISSGRGGARLSHNHERQYAYVMQSLLLWSEIATSMFKLWCLAEQDLLSRKNRYRLCDTGQGLNRVQSAPLVGQAMHDILRRCQSKVGSWVGSSVVHLGDTNVPNALMFIDKYTQVPRILNPVAQVLDEMPRLADRDSNVKDYVEAAFGSVDKCRKYICQDFFRHAFDGSGADNFFDAGSCIDGRLTSAWNWCSKIEKKSYYVVFKMCGFSGFDGDFK